MADGSLNAGSELPEEIPLVPVEVDSEILDVLSDVEAMAALESRIDDLNYLFADMTKAHGMTKGFAMEAERILPNFGGVPIGYYSDAPSATRYKVALEEISKGMWGLIAAGAVAVIALIAKIISWFTGKKSDGGGGSGGKSDTSSAEKNVEQAKEGLQTSIDNLGLVSTQVNHANQVLHSVNVPNNRSLDQRVADIANNNEDRTAHALDLLNSQNPIFHDIVKHGAYFKAMNGIGSQLQLINNYFVERINDIDQILRLDMKDGSTPDEATKNKIKLAAHSKPLILKYDGRDMSIIEMSRYLDTIKEKVESQKVSEKIPFTKLHQSFETALSSSHLVAMLQNVQSITAQLGKFETQLAELEDVARDISTDGLSGAVTEGVGPMIRSTLHAVGQDISGFGRLSWQVLGYVKTIQYMSRASIGLAKEMIRRIAGDVKKEGGEFPKEWDDIVKELKLRSEAVIGRSHFG